jgi:hypothetical protein
VFPYRDVSSTFCLRGFIFIISHRSRWFLESGVETLTVGVTTLSSDSLSKPRMEIWLSRSRGVAKSPFGVDRSLRSLCI